MVSHAEPIENWIGLAGYASAVAIVSKAWRQSDAFAACQSKRDPHLILPTSLQTNLYRTARGLPLVHHRSESL